MDYQKDATVPGAALRSISFHKTQVPGEPAQFHILACDVLAGTLIRVTLARDEAMHLAETIRAATGP
jgi:hypothetical protein